MATKRNVEVGSIHTLVCIGFLSASCAAAPTYTVEQIAAAMAAAEAQFTNLRLDYTFVAPNPQNMATVERIDCTWYRRLPGGEEFFSYRRYFVPSDLRIGPPSAAELAGAGESRAPPPLQTGMRLIEDKLIFFGGTDTLVLNRIPNGRGELTAQVHAGKQNNDFQPGVYSPTTSYIWEVLARYPYWRILTPPAGQFAVVAPDEVMDGVHTVRLAGAVRLPKSTITMTFWVSPTHGFLPVRTDMQWHLSQEVDPQNFKLSGLVKLGENLWFPRLLVRDLGPSQTDFFWFRSISTAKLSDADFRVQIPPGTIVVDAVSGMVFRMRQRQTAGTNPSSEDVGGAENQLEQYLKSAGKN
jgi:hypothetical protein